ARPKTVRTAPQVELWTITIPMAADDGSSQRKLIDDIRRKILDGADFSELARMHSVDSTAHTARDRGPVYADDLTEKIADVAMKIPLNKVSEVIELDNFYTLIKITERTPPSPDVLEKAKRQNGPYFEKWLQQLRENADIKIAE
ncbi:MAG: peptidylprolyl isomerase, partial [Verrucomicrobiota bacterium]